MKKRWLSAVLALLLIVQAVPALAGGFSQDPAAVERAAKSVLMLEVYGSDGYAFATGSGFVAFDSGTLVTNYHVVEDGAWMIAYSDDGYEYKVTKILVADEDKDIAVCAFESPTDMPPLELNADGQLMRAETCVAIGSPKGIRNLVSIGNISSLYAEDGVNWIQFTAPVSNGSSGGALFDDSGRVIGVTSAIYNDEMAQNINFAVHIAEVVHLYGCWDGVVRDLADYEEAVPVDGGTTPTPDVPDPQPDPEPEPEPEPPVGDTSYEPLKRGDFKVAVISLQKALAALGYYDGPTDGVFNEATEAAVIAFNMQNFGTDSPVADEQMQQLLFEGDPLAYGEQSEPDPDQPVSGGSYKPLQRGDFSVPVVKLQKALAALGYYEGPAEGLFNEATEAAVIAFNMQNFGTDSPVADEQMQQLLFEGDPLPYGAQSGPEGESAEAPEEGTEETSAYEPLQRGDFSVAVINLQKGLAALGYYQGAADGVFDEETEAAVVYFNQVNFGTDSPVASVEMQSLIFSGQVTSNGMPLCFAIGNPTYTENGDNTLSVTFSITNNSDKAIRDFVIYVYATGDDMQNIYGNNVYSYTMETPLQPGETVESVEFVLEQRDQFTMIYGGFPSVTYEDGTVFSVNAWEVEYTIWRIG